MRYNVAALLFGLVFALSPVLAFAESTPLRPTEQQFTARTATLQAQIASFTSGKPLACAVVTGKASVRVGEPFALAWDALGASESKEGLPMRGSETIAFSKPGTFRYLLTFYDTAGTPTSCSAVVAITLAQ